LHLEVENHILGKSIVQSTQIPLHNFIQSFLPSASLVKVSHQKFCLARKMLKINFFGLIYYKETLMQNSLCAVFNGSKLLILSVFRANLKNDIKNDTNVLFSHSLRMIYTNSLDTKGRIILFVTPVIKTFITHVHFDIFEQEIVKFDLLLKKTATKKIELLKFNSRFQNEFSSCDKSIHPFAPNRA